MPRAVYPFNNAVLPMPYAVHSFNNAVLPMPHAVCIFVIAEKIQYTTNKKNKSTVGLLINKLIY